MIGSLNNDTAVFHGAVSKSMATLSQKAQATQTSPGTAASVNALALALGDVCARKDYAAQVALTPQARHAIALLPAIDARRQGYPLDISLDT